MREIPTTTSNAFMNMNRRQLSILFRNMEDREKAYKVLAKRTVKGTSKAKIEEVRRAFMFWMYRSPAQRRIIDSE